MRALRTTGAALATSGVLIVAVVSGLGIGGPGSAQTTGAAAHRSPIRTISAQPLAFEPAAGRTHPSVRYIARTGGTTLFLTAEEAVVRFGREGRGVVRTRFEGADDAEPAAESRLGGQVNWLVGPRAHWRRGIQRFARVRYPDLYPGIDLVFHGSTGALEYDFELAPGVDPGAIAMQLAGAQRVRLDRTGTLVLTTPHGTLRQRRPVAWQGTGRNRRPVDVSFRLDGRELGFRVGPHDRDEPLTIDPVLAFSTYSGGSGDDHLFEDGLALDPSGNTYLTGQTQSSDFPVTQSELGGSELFISRYSPTGALEWTTFYGGSGAESPAGIAADTSGVYIGGGTSSADLPTRNPMQAEIGGGTDAFAAKLNSAGTDLIYGTYLGGSGTEYMGAFAVDAGKAYIGGTTDSTNFPLTSARQGTMGSTEDGFITALAADGGSRIFSTYHGGNAWDAVQSLAVNSTGVYATGYTSSTNFPTTASPAQGDQPGDDMFVSKLPLTGASLTYSTYLGGGAGDYGYGIAVGGGGKAYVIGHTHSSDIPASGFQDGYGGNGDWLVAVLDNSGAFDWRRYVGGPGDDWGLGIATDERGNTYAVGSVSGNSVATYNAHQSSSGGQNDAFVLKFKVNDPGLLEVAWSTYLGGSANDTASAVRVASGEAVVAGYSDSINFPVKNAHQPQRQGLNDAWVARLVPRAPVINSGPSGPTTDNTPSFSFSTGDDPPFFQCYLNGEASACNSGSVTYGQLADGTYSFGVEAVDKGGTASTRTERQFVVDTTPPIAFDLTEPADGTQNLGYRPDFSWTAASDGAVGSGITRYDLLVDGAVVASATPATCADGVCRARPMSDLAEGAHTWKVIAVDQVNLQTGSSSTRSFTVATPPTARMAIAPNPALVRRAVTFDGGASADDKHAIARYEWDLDGDGAFEVDTGTSPTTTTTYANPGTVVAGLRVTASTGLTGTTTQELRITSQADAGQLGVTINNGADYTNTPNVTVTSIFPPTTTSLLFSNDGGFLNPVSFPAVRQTRWLLRSTGPERLPKTIYVRFLTNLFVSETFQDDIVLDERPPVMNQATLARAATAGQNARATAARTWRLRIRATDSNSGVDKVQTTANKRKPGRLRRYRRNVIVRSAERPRFVRARDRAKNFSRWRKIR